MIVEGILSDIILSLARKVVRLGIEINVAGNSVIWLFDMFNAFNAGETPILDGMGPCKKLLLRSRFSSLFIPDIDGISPDSPILDKERSISLPSSHS